jgi:hypothetical protein
LPQIWAVCTSAKSWLWFRHRDGTKKHGKNTPIITVYQSSHESCGVSIHQQQKGKGIIHNH